jgi:hypothetical protein
MFGFAEPFSFAGFDTLPLLWVTERGGLGQSLLVLIFRLLQLIGGNKADTADSSPTKTLGDCGSGYV